jgi:hypothetical protein
MVVYGGQNAIDHLPRLEQIFLLIANCLNKLWIVLILVIYEVLGAPCLNAHSLVELRKNSRV